MNRGIDSVATGMAANERWLDVVTNNLANVSTNGYKRDTLVFGTALERELRADGGLGADIGSLGGGASVQGEYTDFSQGPVRPTGNPLDLAIRGDGGAFALQTPQGIKYTRDGSFTISNGRLTSRDGFPVLDDRRQPIDIPTGDLTVANGEILVAGKSAGTVGVFEAKFNKEGGNLLGASNAQLSTTSTIDSGMIEGSNVNAIEAMIAMIKISKAYDFAQKSITSQDELTQRLIQSLASK